MSEEFADRVEPLDSHRCQPAAVSVPRVGARVVLIDSVGSVLLIHERIEGGEHWITPGGGVEPTETLQQAASRELFEETGIGVQVAPHAEALCSTQRLWGWEGVTYDQVDHFFLLWLAGEPRARGAEGDSVPSGRPVVAPAAPTPMETQTRLGHRWWSTAELRSTTETIVPADLADIVAAALERAARSPRLDA